VAIIPAVAFCVLNTATPEYPRCVLRTGMSSSSPQPPPLFVLRLDQRDSVQICCKEDQHGGTTTIWIDTALGHRCESPTLDANQPSSCARTNPDTPAEEDLDAARCLSTNTVRGRGSPEQQHQFDDSISLWMLPLWDDRDTNLEPVQPQPENGTAPSEHGCTTRFAKTESSDDEYSDNLPRRAPLKRRLWTLSAPSAENPNKSRKF